MKCWDCGARPGQPCTDLRATKTSPKPVGYFHAARKNLVKQADIRPSKVTELRSA